MRNPLAEPGIIGVSGIGGARGGDRVFYFGVAGAIVVCAAARRRRRRDGRDLPAVWALPDAMPAP